MFGGMVLIAILLAILAQASGKGTRQNTGDSPARITVEVASRQHAEIVQLSELVVRHEERLHRLTNIAIHATQSEVDSLRQRLAKLEKARRSEKKKLGAHAAKAGEREVELERLLSKVAEIEEQIRMEQSEVEARTLRMPRLRVTDKKPVFFAVKANRLYGISDISRKRPYGGTRGYDSAEVSVDHEPGQLAIVEVRAGLGQPVAKGTLPGDRGRQVLANVDRATEFLSFSVYPDSYAAFNLLKSFFIERGYELMWWPKKAGEPVTIGLFGPPETL